MRTILLLVTACLVSCSPILPRYFVAKENFTLPYTYLDAFVDVRYNTNTYDRLNAESLYTDTRLSAEISKQVSTLLTELSLNSKKLRPIKIDSFQRMNAFLNIYQEIKTDQGRSSVHTSGRLPLYDNFRSRLILSSNVPDSLQVPVLFVYVFGAYNEKEKNAWKLLFPGDKDSAENQLPYVFGYVSVYDLKSEQLYYYNRFSSRHIDLKRGKGRFYYLKELIQEALPRDYKWDKKHRLTSTLHTHQSTYPRLSRQ